MKGRETETLSGKDDEKRGKSWSAILFPASFILLFFSFSHAEEGREDGRRGKEEMVEEGRKREWKEPHLKKGQNHLA